MDAYREEDLRLRGMYARMRNTLIVWRGSDDEEDVTALAQTFECYLGDAWRLLTVYKIASAKLIDMWLSDKMSWRALWRISTNHPYNNLKQEASALEPKKLKLKSKKRHAGP